MNSKLKINCERMKIFTFRNRNNSKSHHFINWGFCAAATSSTQPPPWVHAGEVPSLPNIFSFIFCMRKVEISREIAVRQEQFSILALLWTIWRFIFFLPLFFIVLRFDEFFNLHIFLQYRRNLRTNRFGGNCFRLPFFSERKSLNSIKKNGSDIKRFRAGNKFLIACNYWRSKSLYTSHTGSFAQNSFQIDSINSCCTSKKLGLWLKIVIIIQILTVKPIKGTLGFILEIMKKIARWRHKSEISKRNVKTMISPLLFRL